MIASFCYPYGANRNVKIFIGSDDPDTRKEFSELCGQKKVKSFSVNTNTEAAPSSSTGASNQPLITVGMLERLNGDEKGDAIVSVRGYEPIWTKFTPSYELRNIYFSEGRADISRREAVLFEKSRYVFDINGAKGGKTDEERMEEAIDELDKEPTELLKEVNEERDRKNAELDRQWYEIKANVEKKIAELCKILDGKDSKNLQEVSLENKTILLLDLMENYDQSIAQKMQILVDFIDGQALPAMKRLQDSAM